MLLELGEETKLCLEIMIIYFADVVFYAKSFLPSSSSNSNRKLKEFFLSTEQHFFTYNRMRIETRTFTFDERSELKRPSIERTYQNAFSFSNAN